MVDEEVEYQRHRRSSGVIMLTLIVIGLILTFWLPVAGTIVGVSAVLFFTNLILYTRAQKIRAIIYPYDKDNFLL